MYTKFVADIGGTHARFAVVDDSQSSKRGSLRDIKVFKCADFASPADTLRAYQHHLGGKLPDHACIAAAGPVDRGEVHFTNLDWRLSARDLQQSLQLSSLELVNDFTAVAWSVADLADHELRVLHAIDPKFVIEEGTRVVLGAGTGLGVAGLKWQNAALCVLESEAGHQRFSPADALETEVLKLLQRSADYISMEMLLSGSGIELLHKTLQQINQSPQYSLSAKEITAHARHDVKVDCLETMQLYANILAGFCAQMALSFRARGGVYLVGDILRSIEPLLLSESFKTRYLNAGPVSEEMLKTQLSLVLLTDPGLRGAAARSMAVRQLR